MNAVGPSQRGSSVSFGTQRRNEAQELMSRQLAEIADLDAATAELDLQILRLRSLIAEQEASSDRRQVLRQQVREREHAERVREEKAARENVRPANQPAERRVCYESFNSHEPFEDVANHRRRVLTVDGEETLTSEEIRLVMQGAIVLDIFAERGGWYAES
jgi:hypothetical protein